MIAGLDIGTTKICCVLAEVGANDELIVSGIGVCPSTGIKRGVVMDIDSTVRAIEDSVAKASRQSGKDISSVYVGVTGEHISSLNSKGITAITHPDREIRDEDIVRVNDQSRVIVLPPDRIILHAIARSYAIDGERGIKSPVGMAGGRLEVETHIVTAARSFIDNVEKCVTRAGLSIADMVLEPLATAEAVILPAERDHGVCLVDIGGGTTDMAIFVGGSIYYSAIIPVGGNQVTSDMAQLLRISSEEAERLKLTHGHAIPSQVAEGESVMVNQIGSAGPRPLRRRAICEIIEARMQELFQLVQKEIMTANCHNSLASGIVLTGGGSRLLGSQECAVDITGMPVRMAKPSGFQGLSDSVDGPEYSTAVGLVRYGRNVQLDGNRRGSSPIAGGQFMKALTGWFSRLKT